MDRRKRTSSEMTGEGRTHGGRALETDTPENVANNMVNRTANANQSSENQRNSPRPGDLNDNEHHSENQRNSPLLEDPNGRSAPPPPATISATATATNNNPPTSLENRLSSQSPEDADTRPVPPTSNTRPATRNMGTLRETQALNSSSLWLPKALARMSSVEGADWVEAVALWEELENGEASAAMLAESKDTATSRSTAEKRSRKTDTGKENATSTRRGTKRKLQSEAAVPRATRSSSTRDASRTCRPA
ncbi:hypothetical protein EYR36_002313 [Pleurotus pulmonarius]|nr:hypothetical protein EYR36_002313 [Pleurotus pulmonarius]